MEERQKKIALFIGALSRGGSERVVVNLAEYFVSHGYQVTVVTQYRREIEYPLHENVHRVLSDITEEETTGNRIRNFQKRCCKLRAIWKQERPDIIVSFIGKNNFMAYLTSRFLHIPVVVCVRGEPMEEYYNGWMRLLAKVLFRWTEGIVLQTKRSLEFFPQKVRKKAVILKNPVHQQFFRDRYQGEREKTITAVGRVDANKNHEMLIRAFAAIAHDFPEYRLVIYGEGELRTKLIELATKLTLSDRILLPGSTEEVAEAIYKSYVYVLPSFTEGVPNTLIEAMLMGLTVIATDCPCGGVAELILQEQNGLMIPTGDQLALEKALRNVLSDPFLADQLGRQASKLATSYCAETVYGEWQTFLDRIINGG